MANGGYDASGSVSIIDTAAGVTLTEIPTDLGADTVLASADGARVAVVSSYYPTALVIDTSDPTAALTITLPTILRPNGEKATSAPAMYYTYRYATISPNGDRIYVVSDGAGAFAFPTPA